MHWYNAGLDGRVQEQSQLYQPCEPPFVEPAGEELETLDVPQADLGFFWKRLGLSKIEYLLVV